MTALPNGWELSTDNDLVITRGRLPVRIHPSALPELLAGVSAGLAQTFVNVHAVDADPAPGDAPRGSIRTLHAVTDRHGQGVAVESLLQPDRHGCTVICWLSPVGRYAADLRVARRHMMGRPALPAPECRRGEASVCQAQLVVSQGLCPGIGTVLREGDLAWALLPGMDEPRWLPASTLPIRIMAATGAEPRPHPTADRMVVTTAAALERLMSLTDPSPVDVKAALEAPELTESVCTELAALAVGCTARWSLEWATGTDTESMLGGRLDVLDAGEAGLWQVSTQLPEAVAAELGASPVAVRRISAAEVFHLLTLLVAE